MNDEEYNALRSSKVGHHIGLYDDGNLLRIVLECSDIAVERGDQLCPADFHHLDMLHYLGTESLKRFCDQHSLDSSSSVIDCGAGVGGSSRFLASTYQCQVQAIEYNSKIGRVGRTLNLLQRLQGQVHYSIADLTCLDTSKFYETFDFGISQLVFLHIADKKKLFQSIAETMKSGALLYVEDFYVTESGVTESDSLRRSDFSEKEEEILLNDISVPQNSLLSKTDYVALMESQGFTLVEWTDMTSQWAQFVWQRYEDFLKAQETTSCTTADCKVDFDTRLGWFYQQMAFLLHTIPKDGTEECLYASRYPNALARLHEIYNFEPFSRDQSLGGVQFVVRKK